MSWVKATVRLIHAWRHPDELAREVEAQLRFHIEMRVRANIEAGMRPEEARVAALRSFGDLDRVKVRCCEISRSLPFHSRALRVGLHIAVAVLAAGAALWTVNIPHHNFSAVLRQLIAIAVLTRLFVVVQRSREWFAGDRVSGVFITDGERFRQNKVLFSDICTERGVNTATHDEQGRTLVERMFKSE